jgi:beta-lactamase class A
MRVIHTLLIVLASFAVAAHAAEPAPELRQRAAELVGWANGETAPARLFAPSFLAAVPEAQLKTVTDQLHGSYGAARNVAAIEAESAYSGTVRLAFEKAVVKLTLVVDPAPPHLVTGLLFGGADSTGDTPDSVAAEIAALPGEVSLAAAYLGDGPAQTLLDRRSEEPMAVGSAFKLWVLAELSREVKAGERRWSDVVTLDRASLPSSLLRTWPLGSPLTLHTLAALMISQSDNSAADRLVEVLGREKIERLLPTLGVRTAARDRPLLLTRELAMLKADPALRQRWLAASEAQRRTMLSGEMAGRDLSKIDLNLFSGPPIAIREVEWVASAGDIVRTLDWLRRNADPAALAILAINPGLGAAGETYAYAGYKGGSETGVLNMSFLLRRRDGRWLALVATWNDPAAKLDETRFMLLLSRLLPLFDRS